jgi:hypothetical protein
MMFTALSAAAVEVYLEPEAFIANAFDNQPPKPRKLWIKGHIKAQVHAILGTGLGSLRLKYWQAGRRTAWVLEALGRDRPITAGFVVDDDAIAEVAILIYRESRGWEVRYPFFTDQFRGAELNEDGALDRDIDGITGATLSVRAITGLSRVALLLHREAQALAQ